MAVTRNMSPKKCPMPSQNNFSQEIKISIQFSQSVFFIIE